MEQDTRVLAETEKQKSFNVGALTNVSPLYVFFGFLVTVCSLTFLVHRWTSHFESTDNPVNLLRLTPEKTKKFRSIPVPVRVGLTINNFTQFDMTKDQFVFEGLIWFEFDPTLVSLSTLKQISFERGTIESWSAPITELMQDRMFARFDIRVRFTNYNNYAYFPLDDHRLSLVLAHRNVKLDQIVFVSNDADFVIDQDMSFRGWHEVGSRVMTGYFEERLDKFDTTDPDNFIDYPGVVFTIDYGRQKSVRNVLTIVLPMLLLLFIGLFSLVINREKGFSLVMTLPIQALVGLVTFRFVIESLSPQAGYFFWSDYIFFFFLTLSFLILLLQIIPFELKPFWRKGLIIFFNVLVVGFFACLLWV